MPQKRYLITPGPTPVPPEVLAAIAEPVVHHRGPDFKRALRRVLGRLQEVFRTDERRAALHRSGTGALESAVANLCSPGERVLVVSAGNFGERWARSRSAYGADVVHLRYAWGETPAARRRSPRGSSERAGRRPSSSSHSETSTGVVADVQALARAAARRGALVVVDAISSLGAVPLETDAWGLDVVVSGSQKALMTPPGLAFVVGLASAPGAAAAASRRASTSTGSARARRRRSSTPPFTPAVSLVVGLDVALGLHPRRRARGRLRAPRAARPRVPRGRQGDGARALLARRRPLPPSSRPSACPEASTCERARARPARPPRHHARRRAGRAQGQDLPHRPHRLLRPLRHHDGAGGARARARRAGVADSSAASPSTRGAGRRSSDATA